MEARYDAPLEERTNGGSLATQMSPHDLPSLQAVSINLLCKKERRLLRFQVQTVPI